MTFSSQAQNQHVCSTMGTYRSADLLAQVRTQQQTFLKTWQCHAIYLSERLLLPQSSAWKHQKSKIPHYIDFTDHGKVADESSMHKQSGWFLPIFFEISPHLRARAWAIRTNFIRLHGLITACKNIFREFVLEIQAPRGKRRAFTVFKRVVHCRM